MSVPILGADAEGANVVRGYTRLTLANKGKARREYRKQRANGALLQSFTRDQCERLPVKFRLSTLQALGALK